MTAKHVAVIGAGPAGLMCAERLAAREVSVTIFERMPSPARKFLMAGRGGLNLTHAEPLEAFLARYGDADLRLAAAIRAFPPSALVDWAHGLGIDTFTGTSQRIFPKAMKASPLLRAWLRRLDGAGVSIRTRMRWVGFDASGAPVIRDEATGGATIAAADATVLALGGASWPRLGSDGAWAPLLAADAVPVTPLAPANAGISLAWSEHLLSRCAGAPLKRIALSVGGARARGEAILTAGGLEGGVVYVLNEAFRAALANGPADFAIDLRPDLDAAALAARLGAADRKQSLANTLRKAGGLDAAHVALLNERTPAWTALPRDPTALAARIKSVPLRTTGFSGIARAISTAGGVRFDALDGRFMLRARPGVFVAGEMLDWTAPTGGYLLQACFATGIAAADGVLAWLADKKQ